MISNSATDTPAETRVLASLFAGRTLAETADTLRITRPTAKTDITAAADGPRNADLTVVSNCIICIENAVGERLPRRAQTSPLVTLTVLEE